MEPARRRAIVHVGLPRTGTTTLQRLLHDLRAALPSVGILYPDLTPRSAAEAHLSHQHLGETLDGRRPVAEQHELLGALDRQLAATEADIVVLSYERLCRAPTRLDLPRRLAALFARHGFAMETLATVKPQGELINSTYTWRLQFLREQRVFADYFHAELAGGWLDFETLIRPWQAACDGRVSVVPMRDPRSPAPFVRRVLSELGIAARIEPLLAPDSLALVENRSPGPVAIEVARQLRRGGADLRLGARCREATRLVESQARERGLDAMPFKGLTPDLRMEAWARWDGANERFARSVWGQTWAERVAAEPAVDANEIAMNPPEDDVRLAIPEIVATACTRFGVTLTSAPRARWDRVVAGLTRVVRARRPGFPRRSGGPKR